MEKLRLMRGRWGLFGVCVLLTIVALGAWQTSEAALAREKRGVQLATRDANLPYHQPLAGVNVDLRQYMDDETLAHELERMADLGFVWVRQPFFWAEIEPEQGVFTWELYDRLVEAVAKLDGRLRLVALLDGTPPWARHPAAPEHPFAPPNSPAAFGVFAGALAERYGAQIEAYQIWDEPNLAEHWGELDPRPALYVAMLEAAYRAIHAADDDAQVIAAALAPNVENGPNNINDPAYLRALYELGGGAYFDAAAGKPYGFNFSPLERHIDPKTLNFSRLILLREVMREYGDGDKPLWGGNWGWNSLPDDWEGAPSIWGAVEAETQLAYTQQAYERAGREWPWAGGLILQHWQPNAPADDPIQGFALAPHAEAWAGVLPRTQNIMTPGLYPANTPLATYVGDWTFSPMGADGGPNAESNTITLRFHGTEAALLVRRGDYLAYLDITIDGQPANALPRRPDGAAFITLTAPKRQPSLDLILVAENLPLAEHEWVIRHQPALGDDQFPIVGFAVATVFPQDETPRDLARFFFILGLLGMGVTGWRLPWGAIRWPSPAALRNLGDSALGLFFSAVTMLGGILTFQETLSAALRRDLPGWLVSFATSSLLYYAPSTWLALFALFITGWLIFSRPWLGLVQVLFWSAFFTSTLDPFFRALALVEVLLGLTLAATLARFVYEGAKLKRPFTGSLKTHPLDLCTLALVGLGALSLTWAEFLPQAWREWRVVLLQPLLFYVLIRWQKPPLRDLAFLADALLMTGAFLAGVGLGLYFTGQNVALAEGGIRRLTSVYGSPNSLGLMLGRCLPFALAYLLLPVGAWRKGVAGVSGLLMLIAVALSQSVGAILLGLPTGLGMVLLAWRGRRALPFLAGAGALGALALIPLAQVLPRLRQITDFGGVTGTLRLNLWRSSVELLRENPLQGVGLDQFLYAYRSRYILPAAWQDPDLSHPHNLFLDYWVRLGFFGLLLGLATQVIFWRTCLTVRAKLQTGDSLALALLIGTMGAMANVLAHGLVDMGHFQINLSYVFALLLAFVVQLELEAASEKD
jgi:O-antigen ligase